MSMNLHVCAELTLPSGHKVVEKFELYQTSTVDSYAILQSGNYLKAYLRLYANTRHDQLHRDELLAWLDAKKNAGYVIEWYVT